MTDYLEKSQPYTNTTILLLPAIGCSRRSLVKYGFINGYLADKYCAIPYENAVYLLFRPDSWEKFEPHLQREQQSKNFINQYDYDGGYIVLVYSLLEQWRSDINLFMEGKYSKMSKEYQACFPQWTRTQNSDGLMEDVLSLQYLIFHKGESLQKMWEKELGVSFKDLGPDMEVWGAPNMNKETLDIEIVRTIIV